MQIRLNVGTASMQQLGGHNRLYLRSTFSQTPSNQALLLTELATAGDE